MYGLCQMQPMPHSKFRFLTKNEKSKLKWEKMKVEQETGYIIECDLEYPDHLHEEMNDFPLAPQSLKITHEDLSPYAQGKK